MWSSATAIGRSAGSCLSQQLRSVSHLLHTSRSIAESPVAASMAKRKQATAGPLAKQGAPSAARMATAAASGPVSTFLPADGSTHLPGSESEPTAASAKAADGGVQSDADGITVSVKPKAKRGRPAKAKVVPATAIPEPADGKAEGSAAQGGEEVLSSNGESVVEAAAEAAAEPVPKVKAKRVKKEEWPPGPIYDIGMRPDPSTGPIFNVMSWNVAGLRALLKKEPDAVSRLVAAETADVLCLQETKLQEQHCEGVEAALGLGDAWHVTWNCSIAAKGYSGTAILSRRLPISVHLGIGRDEHDQEGRVITAEFENLFVVNVYVPNAGSELKRLDYRVGEWDRDFAAYLSGLRDRKPVLLCGDLNCAHMDIDIHSPKTNQRSAGFTVEERTSFTETLLGSGLTDAFRRQHPEIVAYTYFGYRMGMRAKGKGWRLDYCLVSDALVEKVHDCYHLPAVTGSDHVPLGIVLRD